MDAAVQGAAGRPWFTRVGRRSGVGRGGGGYHGVEVEGVVCETAEVDVLRGRGRGREGGREGGEGMKIQAFKT